MRIDRHQMVRVDPAGWPTIAAAHPRVADWAMLGRPLIARRRLCEDAAGSVALGLPLPPSMGKQRLAFAVQPEAVLSSEPPPLLSEAAVAAPASWQRAIAALVAIDREVRCFGSLAWEHLTGLPYLSATSDLDLLWPVSGAEDADRLVAAIARIDAPMRIDGEIVAPSGLAIQWREWASDAPELLAKTRDDSRLVARDAVFA